MASGGYTSQRWGPLFDAPAVDVHAQRVPDTKSFAETLDMGTRCEALARERFLAQGLFRAVDAYCDRITMPQASAPRAHGKRIYLDGHYLVAPDFRNHATPKEGYFIDVKGKVYHSFYHKTGHLQQVVDRYVIDDYVKLGTFYACPVFVVFHLCPAWMPEVHSLSSPGRIHAGRHSQGLSEHDRSALIARYPVDDWYYLVNARKIQRLGRPSSFVDYDGRTKKGYFVNVADMLAGPGQGVFPPLASWQSLTHDI